MKRILFIAVVDSSDLMHEALVKFNSEKIKTDNEGFLFIYNIGEEELTYDGAVNGQVVIANNDLDLLTLKPYGKDYLTATADATTVAGPIAGVDVTDVRFYNFFESPKLRHNNSSAIEALKNEKK